MLNGVHHITQFVNTSLYKLRTCHDEVEERWIRVTYLYCDKTDEEEATRNILDRTDLASWCVIYNGLYAATDYCRGTHNTLTHA